MAVSADEVLEMYRWMVKIRTFDERVGKESLGGQVPGFVHQYCGEEAVAAGVVGLLRPDDYLVSHHRGHGHMLVKGGDPRNMMAEIFGKATGYCKGKGGSMHLADLDLGILGANGIVGAGLPIGLGAAFACKYKGSDRVAIVFFGDGASNRGTFHEALNLAAVWNAPVVFVCENNAFAMSVPQTFSMNITDIADRAAGYGMPGVVVDGNDVVACREAAEEAVRRARTGGGPALLECKTWRHHGHFVGCQEGLRDPKDEAAWLKKDPILRCRELLLANKWAVQADLDTMQAEANAEIEAAVEFARSSPWPDRGEVLTDVFVD